MAAKYFEATRHPLPSFCFLLPLLLAYEAGIVWLGGQQPEALRNGADSWVRSALLGIGLRHPHWTPGLLIGAFLVWSWLARKSRPRDLVGLTAGISIESAIFALGLWGLSWALLPFLERLGVRLTTTPPLHQTAAQVLTYVGAGIYEEVVFRLGIYSLLVGVLRWSAFPGRVAVCLGAITSAALFSAAHHVGPLGEPFDGTVFLFRVLAGLYFATLFHLRGFGVAVGTHALYDIMVGVSA